MTKTVKRLICFLFYITGVTPLLFRLIFNRRDVALVLLYHHIREPESPFDPAVRPADFEKHLQFVQKHFETVSASELMNRIEKVRRGPKPPALVTFDDGYRDNLETAYPVLSRYKIPALIFVATGSIDTNEPIWTSRVDQLFKTASLPHLILEKLPEKKSFELGDVYQRLKVSYEIKKEMKEVPDSQRQAVLQELEEKIGGSAPAGEDSGMLSWTGVRKLLEDPLIEIGSHTVSHRMLDHLKPEEIREELGESRKKIESETGRKIDFLSYPGNSYNGTVLNLAREAGYRAAFAVDHGLTYFSQNPFALKRVHIESEPMFVFLAEITMVLPLFRRFLKRPDPDRRRMAS